jgi:hypothetical protein
MLNDPRECPHSMNSEGRMKERNKVGKHPCLFIHDDAYISVFLSFFSFGIAYKRNTILLPLLSDGFLF